MPRRGILLPLNLVALALIAVTAACSGGGNGEPTPLVPEGAATLQVTSAAFENGGPIPANYTCDGWAFSPPLTWSGVPAGTASLALLSEDPDAPGAAWVHWVLYGLAPAASGLPEGIEATETTSGGARQGKNDFKRIGYGGPCPPGGSPHRYFFRLYALDTELSLDGGATKASLLKAMEGHVMGAGQMMGTYER